MCVCVVCARAAQLAGLPRCFIRSLPGEVKSIAAVLRGVVDEVVEGRGARKENSGGIAEIRSVTVVRHVAEDRVACSARSAVIESHRYRGTLSCSSIQLKSQSSL